MFRSLCMMKVRKARRKSAAPHAGSARRSARRNAFGSCERTILPRGRPVPVPTNFYIDMDICMNCGFCAEYCPFDAIKMDHDFDIASYERNVYNLDKLLKPASYYNSIRPENAAREDEARRAKEALKAAKAEAKPAAA